MNVPNHYNIFYSWQSDLNCKANNHFIKDCLENAIKLLNKEEQISVTPRLDKDTEGKSGSPNIADTIFQKIDACQLFIADVTLINSSFIPKILKQKLSPNPNVLIELGYATNRLSWERIICINNTAFSKVEDMPFDIKLNRISQYNFNGKNNNKKKEKDTLTQLLKIAIKSIIDNYPQILSKQQEENVQQHDIKVFRGLDSLINDTEFKHLLQKIVNTQSLTSKENQTIRNIRTYLEADSNQFLIQKIKFDTDELIKQINKLEHILSCNLYPCSSNYFNENTQKQEKETIYQPKQNDTNWDEKEKKMNENIDVLTITQEKYSKFRLTIKEQLFI
jgi:hypothetical protein